MQGGLLRDRRRGDGAGSTGRARGWVGLSRTSKDAEARWRGSFSLSTPYTQVHHFPSSIELSFTYSNRHTNLYILDCIQRTTLNERLDVVGGTGFVAQESSASSPSFLAPAPLERRLHGADELLPVQPPAIRAA